MTAIRTARPKRETLSDNSAHNTDSPPFVRESRPDVVYIMGASRSGSTILGVVLGQAQGTFYVGELCDWPERDGEGSVPHSKAFWEQVRARFGPLPKDAQRYKSLFEHPIGIAYPSGRSRSLRNEYEAVTKSVVEAVKAEAGCDTVIDSSHYPRRARTLRKVLGPGRVRLVFIVRRPSSVARSFRNSGDKGWFMVNAYLTVVGLLAWLTYLTHPKKDRVRISYESLTNSPIGTGARALGRTLDDVDPTDMAPPMVFVGNRFVKSGERIAIRPADHEPSLTIAERLTDWLQWPYRAAGSYAAHLVPQKGRDTSPTRTSA